MTRKQALNLIRAAASQNDTAQMTRLYVENRISREAFNEAVQAGRRFAAFIEKRDAAKGNV